MTALREYQRLETFGIWHASPDEQRRDVIVTLGDATLTICDKRMVALSHWSLPAVVRLNPGDSPALFCPGPDVPELLELDDATMIAAIETVCRAVARRPPPGRLRRLVLGGLAAVAAALVVFWLPGAVTGHAVSVVPPAKRAELGATLIEAMRADGVARCETPAGRDVLDRLGARLLPETRSRIVVLDGLRALSGYLPGGVILLDRRLIENYDDPAVTAGFVLAEAEAATAADPLRLLLSDAGLFAVLRLLVTGELPRTAIARHAARIADAPDDLQDPARLVTRFAEARVPSTPFARAVDPSEVATAALIAGDPVPAGAGRRVLADSDWVLLQGICGP